MGILNKLIAAFDAANHFELWNKSAKNIDTIAEKHIDPALYKILHM